MDTSFKLHATDILESVTPHFHAGVQNFNIVVQLLINTKMSLITEINCPSILIQLETYASTSDLWLDNIMSAFSKWQSTKKTIK
jgi:hypothetical protein